MDLEEGRWRGARGQRPPRALLGVHVLEEMTKRAGEEASNTKGSVVYCSLEEHLTYMKAFSNPCPCLLWDLSNVLESLRGCLRVVFPNYRVRWDAEKKAQKKIVFFLLISVSQPTFNKHLLYTRN